MNVTKYGMLVETLKSEILNGKYGPLHPFPSIRALIRRFRLSDSTVQKAIDELTAKGLVSRKQGRGTFVTAFGLSRTIGLIVPDHGRSEFFPAIVKEISRLAQKEGYSLLFGEVSDSTDKARVEQIEKLARDFISKRAAGIIYQPIDYIENSVAVNGKVLSMFDRAQIPVVLSDYDFVSSPQRSHYDVIGINNFEAGALVVDHLLSAGAKNLHFHLKPFAPQSHRNFMRGAKAAYRDRIVKNHCKDVLVCDPCDVETVRKYCRKNRPDAFVCGNDSTAAKLKKTLWKIGIGVPQDLLLTGVNDLQIATLLTPPLTTIHLPCEQIAEAAFYRLLARIASPEMPATEVFLPVRLVVRDSTKKVSITKKAKKK